MSLTRRELLRRMAKLGAGAAAFWALRGTRASAGPEAVRRPNLLFIMADDHAAYAISCYGSRINETPNIDRIAREGMRFANAFATNALCAPSRAVLLTGKYSHLNGQKTNGGRFDGSQPTFPKLLQQAGYQTAIVGKWHLGSDPTGFDYWNILPGQGSYWNPAMIEMGRQKKHEGYVTDIITDSALGFLKGRSPDKPFCLLVHHKAPHRNWQPDKSHANLYEDREIPEPETFNDDLATRASAASHARARILEDLTKSDVKASPPANLSPQELKKWKYQRFIKDYLRCVASVDDSVGRFLDFLDEQGLRQDTLVVYTSDQGFFLGDHGWFDKRFIYEQSSRMPLLARYPREIQPGSTNDQIVLNLDFAPTFLDFAGLPIPQDMQGASLRPLLRGQAPAGWRQSMYYHYYEYPGGHGVYRHCGVRTRRYKLVYYYGTNEWELFDLEKDPRELRNVADDPAYAQTVEELKAELERLRLQYQDDSIDPDYLAKQKPPAKAKDKRPHGAPAR